MDVVQDVDRLDKDGKPPRMKAIREQLEQALAGLLPYVRYKCDDNLCSNVTVWASFDPKEQWNNGIMENSHYFIASIHSTSRWYESTDEKVTVEMYSCYRPKKKFRRYTASVEKVIKKLKDWIENEKK